MAERKQVYTPSSVKLEVVINASGFNMDTDDCTIEIVGRLKSQTFKKSDLYHDPNDGKWYVCFNLIEFGPGPIKAISTAHVPDAAFANINNGIRDVVTVNNLFVAVKP